MSKLKLFDDESDADEDKDVSLKFNESYAKNFNKFRQKEFIKKLKDQDSDSSDSDDSDSSEDAETIDPKFDKEFFKTLSSLKSRDPKIYEKNTKFFEEFDKDECDATGGAPKKDKTKPFTLKDYERKVMLEKGGKFEDDSDEEENTIKRPASPSLREAEDKIKSELKNILNESDDEDFEAILKRREKSKQEVEREDEEFVKWLAGQKDEVEETTKSTLKPLKQFWDDPALPRNEKFLRDYVLNKGYYDTEVHDVPRYEEIVGPPLSDDERELEKQAEFEHKFNFRYEEPDQEFIKRYPRTIENSVRQTDESRKKKRQETKERKEREKAEKMKELEMLKEMKRQEIEEKINKLKEVTGNEDLPIKEDELESEFDPDAHDRRMGEIFDDEYYQVDEGEEKPDCPDFDELKIEDWDNFDPNQADINQGADYGGDGDDDDIIMDCDYEENSKLKLQNEVIESTRDRRKRRRRNRFMEMIKTEKPVFDPEDEKTYAEYVDEYYKLDCEDFIGEMPCRFKYVECEPNDFGLTIEEILLAKNKELNQWASLKKAVQIRPSHVDKKERRLYQMKAQNETLKRKIFTSLYGEQSDEEKDKEDDNANSKEQSVETATQNGETATAGKKKKKKKKKSKANTNNEQSTDANQNNTTTETVSQPKAKKQKVQEDETSHANDAQGEKKSAEERNKKPKSNAKTDSTEGGKSNESKSKNKKWSDTAKNNGAKKFGKAEAHGVAQSSKQIKKNKFKPFNKQTDDNAISDERLKAYGLNPRKFNKSRNFFNNPKNKHLKQSDKSNSKSGGKAKKKNNPFA